MVIVSFCAGMGNRSTNVSNPICLPLSRANTAPQNVTQTKRYPANSSYQLMEEFRTYRKNTSTATTMANAPTNPMSRYSIPRIAQS